MSFAAPHSKPGFETNVVSDPAGLPGLREQWRTLWNRSPHTTPFQSPDWLIPWWDIFAPGDLRIIAVSRGNQLVALAPLYREGERLLPIGVSLSDYLDVLVDQEHRDAGTLALADALDAMEGIQSFQIDELSPDGVALQISPAGWEEVLSIGSSSPVLALPESVEELSGRVSPSRLRHLRTARRRVAKRGDAAILEGDADNAGALLSELMRLHAKRWQRDEQKGVFADPRVEVFHAAALPGMLENRLARLYALTIGDDVVGVYYGFHHAARAYAYIGGYDPDYAFESPSSVLLGHAIEEAIREGTTEFDFLRGCEDYKYEWGAKDRWNVRLTLKRRHHGR